MLRRGAQEGHILNGNGDRLNEAEVDELVNKFRDFLSLYSFNLKQKEKVKETENKKENITEELPLEELPLEKKEKSILNEQSFYPFNEEKIELFYALYQRLIKDRIEKGREESALKELREEKKHSLAKEIKADENLRGEIEQMSDKADDEKEYRKTAG